MPEGSPGRNHEGIIEVIPEVVPEAIPEEVSAGIPEEVVGGFPNGFWVGLAALKLVIHF